MGPLLFILYTSKLFNIVERYLPDVHAYANDTQLYLSLRPDSDAEQVAAVETMQRCIEDIRQWMLNDHLKLNADKTEFIMIGTQQQLAKVNIDKLQVSGSVISPSRDVKKLGCWLDTNMKFDTHISKC